MFSKRVWILSYWLLLKNSSWRVWNRWKNWKVSVVNILTSNNSKNCCSQAGTQQKYPQSWGKWNICHSWKQFRGLQNRSTNGHQFADICKVCGKEGNVRDIRNHIEANHLEGVVIPYNLCDKTFRSRNSFRTHKSRQHTNKFACSQNWFKFKLLKPLWWSFWVQKCFETS